MWIYVKRVPVQDLLTLQLKTNISNKAPLPRTALFSLLFETHHNSTLDASPLNTVCWCLPCYLRLVASRHFQEHFLTPPLLRLPLTPFNLHAFTYSSLSIIPIALWGGAFFVLQLFQYIPLFSTAFSSTHTHLWSFHHLSNIILIPNVTILYYLFLGASVFCKLRYPIIAAQFSFLYLIALVKPVDRWSSSIFLKYSLSLHKFRIRAERFKPVVFLKMTLYCTANI